MQAVSTMPIMKVSILRTGITPHNNNRYGRCKLGNELSKEEDLRLHTENVHNKVETEEDREGLIQKS